MPSSVKNEKGYAEVKFNAKAIKDAYSKTKSKRKLPTSVNLPEEVILELKSLAMELEVPYQTLMRKFITEGLAKRRKSA